MERKELYAKVKELNAQKAIHDKFGDNFTRVPNANLEAFLKGFAAKTKKATKKACATPKKKEVVKNCPSKEAMIKLLSTLQAKRLLTAKEAEEVAKVL